MNPPEEPDLGIEYESRGNTHLRVAVGAGLLTLLSITYLTALTSPLRLSWDAIVYLSLAREMVSGEPYEPRQPFPLGYPRMLALLDWVGLGHPSTFVATNLVFLAIGLVATYFLLRRSFQLSVVTSVFACCAILLVHDVISVAAVPLSDATFFGVTMLCLVVLERAAQLRGIRAAATTAAGIVLAAAAVEVRTIGIALWPAVLFAIVSHADVAPRLRHSALRHPAAAAFAATAVIGGLGAVAFARVRQTGYIHGLTAWDPSAGTVLAQTRTKLSTLGELVSNVTSTRWPSELRPLLVVAGVVFLAIVALGVMQRRRLAVPDVFALSLVLVLAAWPQSAPRLWIPAAPILIGYATLGARVIVRAHVVRLAIALYLLVFAAAGTATLVHSACLSLSGPEFADRWAPAWPRLRTTYQVAFGRPIPANVGPVRPDALRLLCHYERLASTSVPCAASSGARHHPFEQRRPRATCGMSQAPPNPTARARAAQRECRLRHPN